MAENVRAKDAETAQKTAMFFLGEESLKATYSWPPESLDSERRFDHPAARLYPLIGKRVRTPFGTGMLHQVFADRAAVELESAPGKLKIIFLRNSY